MIRFHRWKGILWGNFNRQFIIKSTMPGIPGQSMTIAASIVIFCVFIKILLVPAYRSTDFEVHRNWMAITYSKPFKDWYKDGASTSPWTLDYPPLFAWFEWMLAQMAQFVDSAMLNVDYLDYASNETILFQRVSVILSESVLVCATWLATRGIPSGRRYLALFLVLGHPGIMIVDNIHFQYNGMLLGLLILSISFATFSNDVLATVIFTMLLCFKHIFLYVAPAFGAYYLGVLLEISLGQSMILLVQLSLASLLVLFVTFWPFYQSGAMLDIVSRLFPVQRGLVHAYWAPNFWALYAGADKLISFLLNRVGLGKLVASQGTAALTGGLVGTSSFSVLPEVSSGTTAAFTVLAMAPSIFSIIRRPYPGSLCKAVVYMSLCSFLFGYHVHEKAILITLIPLAIMAAKGRDPTAPSRYIFLSTVGTYSLFPLLTEPQEYLIKIFLSATYLSIAIPWLQSPNIWKNIFEGTSKKPPMKTSNSAIEDSNLPATPELSSRTPPYSYRLSGDRTPVRSAILENQAFKFLLNGWQILYLLGIIPVELYSSFIHNRIFGDTKWQFIPLMLISIYCSVGIHMAWLQMVADYVPMLLRKSKMK
eukprot:jgi/Picsp_1/1481/NSC_04959-R1_dolichyl pyrophosphate glc1man9 c2 alpha- -glucosyltransferase